MESWGAATVHVQQVASASAELSATFTAGPSSSSPNEDCRDGGQAGEASSSGAQEMPRWGHRKRMRYVNRSAGKGGGGGRGGSGVAEDGSPVQPPVDGEGAGKRMRRSGDAEEEESSKAVAAAAVVGEEDGEGRCSSWSKGEEATAAREPPRSEGHAAATTASGHKRQVKAEADVHRRCHDAMLCCGERQRHLDR